MRVLGAAYTTAMGVRQGNPCFRVRLANHGGVFADPLDVTDHVISCEVSRPLRDGNSATIILHSESGQFAPLSGIYELATKANNAQVQIDLGEVIGGVQYFWRVFTGGINACEPGWGIPVAQVTLECLDGGQNWWQQEITSYFYEAGLGSTPLYYTAHEIIKDLFEAYAGLDPFTDFTLDPLSDWPVLGDVQFEQEPLAIAAAKLLQPKGYRLFFDYDGLVSSALLLPAGLPATWAVAGTIAEEDIAILDGPKHVEPLATRVRVTGGTSQEAMVNVADHSVLGTTRYAYDHPGGNKIYGGSDCYYLVEVNAYRIQMWIQGDVKALWREHCSHLAELRFSKSSLADFAIAPVGVVPFVNEVLADSDEYHGGMDRHVACVELDTGDKPWLWIDLEMDVWGHPYQIISPQVYAQDWDNALIASWGEKGASVEAPIAQDWNDAWRVADLEMTIASLSEFPSTVTLKRFDLRIEVGDVWLVENSRGANFKLWVKQINYGASPKGGITKLTGYRVP